MRPVRQLAAEVVHQVLHRFGDGAMADAERLMGHPRPTRAGLRAVAADPDLREALTEAVRAEIEGKPIVIVLDPRWNCTAGVFRAELVVRPEMLSSFIQTAIAAKGHRTLLARGGLEIRVRDAKASTSAPTSPATSHPVKQLSLLEEPRS